MKTQWKLQRLLYWGVNVQRLFLTFACKLRGTGTFPNSLKYPLEHMSYYQPKLSSEEKIFRNVRTFKVVSKKMGFCY